MNLKRKFKRRDIFFDISNNEIKVTDVYEDVLEEGLLKRVLKDYMIWLFTICAIFQLIGIIIVDGKINTIIFTITFIFFLGALLYRFKKIKNG
jgi:hypothetical protein